MGETLKRTALYDRHITAGARIVPFAGYEMPVQYDGILAEHQRVREQAGLFDIGHMGQVWITGPDALSLLQYTTTNDISTLAPGEAKYTLLSTEQGGEIDDLIVYRAIEGEEGYMVVMNAANKARDVQHFQDVAAARTDLSVTINDISAETGMIAIQGPKAPAIMQKLVDVNLDEMPYYTWTRVTIADTSFLMGRTGYTGEDGFEVFPPIDKAGTVWDAILEAGKDEGLTPIGLGARDTLRLEARMPLYGQELGEDISPYEAGLGWAVKLDKGDFIGRDAMAAVKEAKPARKSVCFKLVGRGPSPRTHYPVTVDGDEVGYVTSGAFSPTLGENIGLALIKREYAGVDKPLQIMVRGKAVDAIQVKSPFYKREK